jgi:decaprenylphospho-beta-D-ribofuranose 2-oxidase
MRRPAPAELTGWGRHPRRPGRLVVGEDLGATTAGAALSRGLGRSYGDASLPAAADDVVAGTTLADRLLAFDEATGALRAEAGLSLLELNRVFLRRGWFVPVTPGTQFVTLGGMVAADVHGKNHHGAGTFGAHVTGLVLRTAAAGVVACGPDREPDLFRATLGGMGLTGHILEVAFRMERIPSPWIMGESERLGSLEAVADGLAAARDWPFTAAWLDTLAGGRALGRGILFKGRWAAPGEARAAPPRFRRAAAVPFQAPDWMLSRPSLRLFNLAYYGRHAARVRRGLVHPQAFFYPLDAVERWNLLYGRRGLTQYQCLVPHAPGHGPIRRVLELARALGVASFLTVLKDFGAEGHGLLSFPAPGLTLTLDLPVRPDTPATVARLNDEVADLSGRVYLAKDAFTSAEHFRRMEPRLPAWQAVRRRWDPEGRLRSAQSVRLLGDAP